MSNIILVDGQFPDDIRIAHMHNNKLVRYQHYSINKQTICGNIYFGQICKQYKHLGAAFVDIGDEKHGFIQNFKYDNNNLFQVIKDTKGKKCATLTKFITLNGRYLIYQPYGDKMQFADQPFIIKYPNISNDLLKQDSIKLLKIWDEIQESSQKSQQPRTLRKNNDILDTTIKDLPYKASIIVEGKGIYQKIRSIIAEWAPDIIIKYFHKKLSLFETYKIEDKIAALHAQQILLPSGGSMIITQTESMIVIDINSGKSHAKINVINLEATNIIAEQIKLRNLSGLIIVDFIENATQELCKKLKTLLEEDYAYNKITHIPNTSTVEVTRQRIMPSILENVSVTCDKCEGAGVMLSTSCATVNLLRQMRSQLCRAQTKDVVFTTSHEIGEHLLNHHRDSIEELQTKYKKSVKVKLTEQ